MTTDPPPAKQTCHECRYHSKTSRPSVVERALEGIMDTIVEFKDEDETVYHCRAPAPSPYAGREVGPVPLHCDSFDRGSRAPDGLQARVDAMMARVVARAKQEGGR